MNQFDHWREVAPLSCGANATVNTGSFRHYAILSGVTTADDDVSQSFWWWCSGVDFSVAGTGGRKCRNYIPSWSMLLETIIISLFSIIFELYLPYTYIYGKRKRKNHQNNIGSTSASKDVEQDKTNKRKESKRDRMSVSLDEFISGKSFEENLQPTEPNSTPTVAFLRTFCCIFHALVWGLELSYKLSTRQMIWILNPCHVITFTQLSLLLLLPWKSNPEGANSKTSIYRNSKIQFLLIFLHTHTCSMNGPLLALLFPILNTRYLPGEQGVYWLQHFLILFVPFVLVLLLDYDGNDLVEGEFEKEEKAIPFIYGTEFRCSLVFGLGVQRIYNLLILQPIAFVTGVNLNNIMCPAISDPFSNTCHYRYFVHCHQTLLVFVLSYIYAYLLEWWIYLYYANTRYIQRAHTLFTKKYS
ncbi:hypothetical protein SNEBB_004827 [Seison nebaliae]|nr:hypothetical protein SNEBB_004827 [Seison nebaliae]